MKAPSGMSNSIGSAMRVGAALAIAFLPLGATRSEAAGLQEGTLKAWEAYPFVASTRPWQSTPPGTAHFCGWMSRRS